MRFKDRKQHQRNPEIIVEKEFSRFEVKIRARVASTNIYLEQEGPAGQENRIERSLIKALRHRIAQAS
jgi:hypothetical protein